MLSQWLYTQRLNGELGGKGKAGLNLPRLWILAEKLLMPRLQNLVIGLIESFRFKHSEICSSMFQYVWDNTCANSPLRRLYVHQCVWNLTKESYHSVLDHFPKQMLADICFQFRENANNQTKFSRNMVDFHVKEEEKSLRPLFEHSRSIPSKMFWAMT